uniref:Uncharacterized protein n=1 Tax=Magallana gigas TaxID=29159 RepID=A0A8W8M9C8_MAGGI
MKAQFKQTLDTYDDVFNPDFKEFTLVQQWVCLAQRPFLEELTCRVLGDLFQEGVVAKLADDLYCGGSTRIDLLYNFTRTLQALQRNGLNLSASKTVITPRETTIFGGYGVKAPFVQALTELLH